MSRPTDERGTPSWFIALVREVMGHIDFDPASCAKANEVVGATVYCDKEIDGLKQQWFGRVYLNPPFSLSKQFIDKLICSWLAGDINEAIVLVNYSTGAWFHHLLNEACDVGFIKHHPQHPTARIEFCCLPGNDRNTNNNSTGQVVFYFGPDAFWFRKVFEDHCTFLG